MAQWDFNEFAYLSLTGNTMREGERQQQQQMPGNQNNNNGSNVPIPLQPVYMMPPPSVPPLPQQQPFIQFNDFPTAPSTSPHARTITTPPGSQSTRPYFANTNAGIGQASAPPQPFSFQAPLYAHPYTNMSQSPAYFTPALTPVFVQPQSTLPYANRGAEREGEREREGESERDGDGFPFEYNRPPSLTSSGSNLSPSPSSQSLYQFGGEREGGREKEKEGERIRGFSDPRTSGHASPLSNSDPTNAPPSPSLSSDEAASKIQVLLERIRAITVENLQEEDEQKMWDILNTLEEWRKSHNEILRNNQFLGEIKATLLPLIAALNKPRMSSSEEMHPETELAHFDDSFKLKLNVENWHRLRCEESARTDLSNVISVLGDTHVGKSTIVSALLNEARLCAQEDGRKGRFAGNTDTKEPETPPAMPVPAVAQPQQNAPTTSNVNFYSCDAFVDDQKVLFLDLEGENGGQPPRSAITERLLSLLEAIGVTEYQERRRNAVADNLSRLAFVTSDIVLFIWNESFANASYMKRVRQLAVASTHSVDSASSPALVLIYNKCDLDEEFDIERCTAQFFENQENAEVLRLYSEVACVCIPHLDQVKKIRSTVPGKPPMIIDGEEIFHIQIRKLHKLLQNMLQRRMEVREAMGTLFSFHVWLLLFRMVLDRFDQKLRMGEILTYVLRFNNDSMSSMIFRYFVDAYTYGGRFTKKEFLRCREAAIQLLATQFVDHLRSKQDEMDKFIIHTFRSESFQAEAIQVITEFMNNADKLAPCESVLQCPDGQFVHCTQERMCHSIAHRTSERVFSSSTSPSLVTRTFENMQGWLRIGYRPTWTGLHTFGYPLSPEGEIEQLKENIELLSKSLPSSYFLTKISVLQKVMLGVANTSLGNKTEYCWICVKNMPDRMLMPCGHIFCQWCVRQMQALHDDQAAVPLRQVTEEPYGVLQKNHCPLCNVAYARVAPFTFRHPSSRERLQKGFERFVKQAEDILLTQ